MLAAVLLSSQTFSQDRIITQTTNNETFLEFKNGNGQILKSLNIKELSPYTNEFKPAYTGTRKLRFFTESNASTPGKAFGIVCHRVVVYEQETYPEKGDYQRQDLGQSTVVIYDSTGSEVWRKIIPIDNAIWPYVTPNGRYATIGYVAGSYGQSGKSGFMVYDVKTNTVVLDFQCTPAYVWQFDDLFTISEWDSERYTYYAFDTQQLVLRKKTYTRSESSMIKRHDPKGLIFLVPPDKERLDRYDIFEEVKY